MSALAATIGRLPGGTRVSDTVWHFQCPACGARATYRGTPETWKCPRCDQGGTSRDLAHRFGVTSGMDPFHSVLTSADGNVDRLRDVARETAYAVSPEETAEDRARQLPVEAFPVEVFPDAVARLITDGAAAVGCPVDMIAVPFLSYAAAAIGNRATLRIKRTFRQRPILWTVVVARSGKMKTPADKVAREPIAGLQRAAAADYDRELAEHSDAIERGESRPRPRMASYYTTDATFEALGPMLTHAPGLAIARDEIVGFVKACDAYRGGRGGDRQKYLETWDGSPLKVDRKSTDTLFVGEPVLCIAGGCQPLVLPDLTREASQHDGFIPRFLWTYPDVGATTWRWDDVDEATVEAVTGTLRDLRAMAPVEVALSDDAKSAWAAWATQNMAATAAATGIAASVSSKMEVQVSRLALVLHCLWQPGDVGLPVHRERLAGATVLGDYFRSHANRALCHFDRSTAAGGAATAERVWLALIRDGGGWIDKTELRRRLGNNYPAAEVDAALATLRDQGRAEGQKVPGHTKPFDQWRGRTTDSAYALSQAGIRIWVCAGCGTARSRDATPCPACGAMTGRWQLKENG